MLSGALPGAHRRSLTIGCLLIAGGLCCSCTYRWNEQIGQPIGEGTPWPVLLMEQPLIGTSTSAELAFMRTWQMNNALADAGVAVVAPWEFNDAASARWPQGETLTRRLLADNALDASNTVRLAYRIEESQNTAVTTASVGFGGATSVHYDSDLRLVLELQTLNDQEPIVTISVVFEDDPDHDAANAYDQRPRITRTIDRAAVRLANWMESHYSAPYGGETVELETVYNLRGMFYYGGAVDEPLADTLATMPPLDRFVEAYRWLAVADPELSPDEAEYFLANPEGLLVRDCDELCDAGLLVGDYIVAANGEQTRGEHALQRVFLRTQPGDTVEIRVLRGSEIVDLIVDR